MGVINIYFGSFILLFELFGVISVPGCIIAVIIRVPLLRLRGETKVFRLTTNMGYVGTIGAPNVALIEPRLVAKTVIIITLLYLYFWVEKLALEELIFL